MSIQIQYNVKKYLKGSKSAIDVTCQAFCQQDPNIFVMQKLPKNALGQVTYRFSHVADLVDLEDWPDSQQDDYAYFRTNKVTLRVRSQFQAQSIINTMRQEVKALSKALSFLQSQQGQSFSQTY